MDLQEININRIVEDTIKTIYNENDIDKFKQNNENTYLSIKYAINSVLAEIAYKQLEEAKRKIEEDKIIIQTENIVKQLRYMYNL